MTGNVEIRTPELGAEPLKIGYGLALDIGTQKVGAYLYDLASGSCAAWTCAENGQSVFGATVMERIAYASDDSRMLRETAVIREQVFDLILELTAKASAKTGVPASFADVRYVSVAGNTVMQHLYAATSPKSIGIPPHQPVTLFGEQILAEPTMYFCPCLDGFTGGDLTAALLGSGASVEEKCTLLLDLGTEWGLALGNRDGYLCTVSAKENAGKVLSELLAKRNCGIGSVENVLIAGSADMTAREADGELDGILPKELLGKARYTGNAAGYGACLALCERGRKDLRELTARCELP